MLKNRFDNAIVPKGLVRASVPLTLYLLPPVLNFDSTVEVNAVDVNAIQLSIVYHAGYMLCKSVKDSCFNFYLPQTFKNCDQNYFVCSLT